MRTQAAYDRWAGQYDSDPNPQLTLEFEEVLGLVDPRPGQRILDAACGTGRYTKTLAQARAKVTGIDFSRQMLAIARQNAPDISFIYADLMDPLPFDSAAFDTILCAQAIKHLPDLHHVFKEFARTLVSGGACVFSVTHPDMNWEGYELADQNPDRFRLSEHADIHHHQFSNYFEAIDDAGFLIDRIVQIPVSEKIKHLLTPQSFQIVRGRYQILSMRLVAPLK